jgi:hypothetical protein
MVTLHGATAQTAEPFQLFCRLLQPRQCRQPDNLHFGITQPFTCKATATSANGAMSQASAWTGEGEKPNLKN